MNDNLPDNNQTQPHFKLSKLRLSSLAKARAARLCVAVILAVIAVIGLLCVAFCFKINAIVPTRTNVVDNTGSLNIAVVEEVKIFSRNLSIKLDSNINADDWEILCDGLKIAGFSTKAGIAQNETVVFNTPENKNSIELRSSNGYSKVIDVYNSENSSEVIINVQGDFKPTEPVLQLQNPELPNGCEATSLAMLLTAYGQKIDKALAAETVPSQSFYNNENGELCAPNPAQKYAGDPASKTRGFYCFAPPVIQAAKSILAENNVNLSVIDATGKSFEEITELSQKGYPIMIWVTIDYGKLKMCKNFVWKIEESNEIYLPIANLHCVVLKSASDQSATVLDPIKGEITMPLQKLANAYNEMGKRAVYIT